MYLLKTAYVEIIYKAKKDTINIRWNRLGRPRNSGFGEEKYCSRIFPPNGLRKNLVANLT